MNRSLRILLIGCVLIFFARDARSQLSGQNIAEAQFGKIPTDSSSFVSIYDRLVLDYDLEQFKVGMTVEQYWSPYASRNYIRPNQFRAQFKTDTWDVRIGNFYETLGRGTLLRTYQVPGAVLETISYRSRNYFHRDFLGAYAKFQQKSWSVKALAGQPLNNVFPPTEKFKSRRPDSVAMVGADYQLKTHRLEYNAMYLKNQNDQLWYSMTNLSGQITPSISYFTELTFENKNSLFGKDEAYGWYLNVNFSFDRLNITTELKDYNNLLIGEAVNEPPALIKQHVYRVLNRSTHVPIPINESGYQLEATYLFEDNSLLTFNHSRALNKLGIDFRYVEFFMEYARLIYEKWDIKLFIDYADDDIKGQKNRISTGVDWDFLLKKRRSFNLEYEYQTFLLSNERSTNSLFALTYNHGSNYTVSLLSEISTDKTVFESQKDYKIWLGGNFKYKPGFRDTFLIFAGTRRGGPACTSGVCYEILDFEGVELRYTRRF